MNCAKTSLGPGIDFGPARVQVIGQSWYNTVAEDLQFKGEIKVFIFLLS